MSYALLYTKNIKNKNVEKCILNIQKKQSQRSIQDVINNSNLCLKFQYSSIQEQDLISARSQTFKFCHIWIHWRNATHSDFHGPAGYWKIPFLCNDRTESSQFLEIWEEIFLLLKLRGPEGKDLGVVSKKWQQLLVNK